MLQTNGWIDGDMLVSSDEGGIRMVMLGMNNGWYQSPMGLVFSLSKL